MARLNAAAMTPVPGHEPFTLQPLIGHLLQTRRCISGSIFVVEAINVMVVEAAAADEDDTHAIRLVLGDGELCIQALLHPDMFYLVKRRNVFVGCCVSVGDFVVRLEGPDGGGVLGGKGGETKPMAYLIVNKLETVGWNKTYMALRRRRRRRRTSSITDEASIKEAATAADEDRDQGAASGETTHTTPRKASKPRSRKVVRFADQLLASPPAKKTPTKTPTKVRERGKARVRFKLPGRDEDDEDAEEAFEAAFETRTLPLRSAITGNSTTAARAAAAAAASTAPKTPASDVRETVAAAGGINTDKSQPVALPRDWHDQQAPLKLTTLRQIPHLPYAQNWSVNVLAIVASLSPVEPSHLPPGQQRTARLADPSTAKQVHLTVFLDPDGFTPKVGSAVLLVGVKNHRFDGGSLKKYASDGERRWWFEDPLDLDWLDVAGIKEWWKGMGEYCGQTGPARSEV